MVILNLVNLTIKITHHKWLIYLNYVPYRYFVGGAGGSFVVVCCFVCVCMFKPS